MNKNNILLVILLTLFTACLTNNLDELPVYDESNVTNVGFLYRFTSDEKGANNELKVKEITLSLDEKAINNDKASIVVSLKIPAVSKEFTQEERDKVNLKNIIVYFNVSTAANVEPIDGSPELGVPGDFAQLRKYKVIAANGDSKVWTLTIKSLNK